MRRSLAAGFTVFIAGVLSLALAVPAHAEDIFTPQPKPGGAYTYKYGWDYYKAEWRSTPGAPNLFTNGGYTAQPVNPTVAPSTGKALVPTNAPLTGKIIEPGKTPLRAPSTYRPVTTFFAAGSTAMTRLLGAAGFGIGGVTPPPANWKEIALAQGVRADCLSGAVTCTRDEIDKQVKINNCQHTNTCASIGATEPDGTGSPFGDWFKDTALPFLEDLWGQITGQTDEGDVPDPNGHYRVVPRGCSYAFDIEHRGGNDITLHSKQTIVAPRPSQAQNFTGNIWWGSDCTPAKNFDLPSTIVKTTCMDNATKRIANGSTSYGYSQGLNAFDPVTGFNKGGLCVNGATQTLVMVQVVNTMSQSQYDAQSSIYKIGTYTDWLNPDPEINFIEDTTITTSWDCKAADGFIYSYTKTVAKIAAAIQPQCPAGTELVKHKIESKTGANDVRTLDEGAAVPGAAAQYPGCLGATSPGCTMDVWVDGTVCTTMRPECSNWPAINSVTPSRIQCHWGSYTVPSSDCLALSNGYKTETGVVFDPHSGSWVGIDIYGNPQQPNPEPWNPTNPNPVPGGSPGTPPATGTGTGTPTFPQTGTNPATGDGCTSPGWSWNPVEWVKNPVVCALKDAFVPKTDVAGRMGTISTVLLDKPPLNWLTPPPMTGPGGGGCPNWVISIPYAGLSENVVCESSFTAAVVGARYPLFGLVATAMVWPLMRSIWYAAIPILRVSPGSHK